MDYDPISVHPDMLDELMAFAGAPDVGILAPKIYYSAVLQLAFGLGVPVVTTRTGGANEVVKDDVTGFLVESGDVAQPSAAITRFFRKIGRVLGCDRAATRSVWLGSVDPNLGTMNLIMGTAAPNRLGNGIDSHDSGTPH